MELLRKKQTISDRFEEVFEEEVTRLFEAQPQTAAFHRGEWVEFDYYRRHVLETLLRIRINNRVDAYALYQMSDRLVPFSRTLARYLEEEFGHDGMFLSDLKKMGMTSQEIESATPFYSTFLLMDFMKGAIDRDGGIPTAVWNYLVELYSDRFNPVITRKARENFGIEAVGGAEAHLTVDEKADHVGLMLRMLTQSLRTAGDEQKVEAYLRHFIRLIGLYFAELYETTMNGSTSHENFNPQSLG